MKIRKMLHIFYKLKLLSPFGLYKLFSAILKYGINVMTLLRFSESIYGNKVALVDENETLSYQQLRLQSDQLSLLSQEKYQLKSGQRVGFICKNHASLVKSIFAVSQLGADIFLLNAEMSKSQFIHLLDQYDFDLIIYDYEWSSLIEQSNYMNNRIVSYHDRFPAISNLINTNLSTSAARKRQRTSMSKIIVLTGGTTGHSKIAAHQPSIFNYLNPFLAFITRLNLLRYNTAYISTPIYHDYGVAVLFLFIALGKKIVIYKGFDAEKACRLIHEHQVEVVTVVPLMIYKILKWDAYQLK